MRDKLKFVAALLLGAALTMQTAAVPSFAASGNSLTPEIMNQSKALASIIQGRLQVFFPIREYKLRWAEYRSLKSSIKHATKSSIKMSLKTSRKHSMKVALKNLGNLDILVASNRFDDET